MRTLLLTAFTLTGLLALTAPNASAAGFAENHAAPDHGLVINADYHDHYRGHHWHHRHWAHDHWRYWD
jgi:hypothetical protein